MITNTKIKERLRASAPQVKDNEAFMADTIRQINLMPSPSSELLLPIVLLLIHLHNPIISFILLGIVLLGFTVFVIAKALLLYYKGLLSIFYILLYFTCLEIIPVMGMLLWTQHILQ